MKSRKDVYSMTHGFVRGKSLEEWQSDEEKEEGEEGEEEEEEEVEFDGYEDEYYDDVHTDEYHSVSERRA